MAKLELNTLSNLQNEASAVGTINSNMEAIEDAMENTLSRDGTTPNSMEADLDMNTNRIMNLPEPEDGTEPLRLADADMVLDSLDEIEDTLVACQAALAATEIARDAALVAETNAETAETNAELAETNAEAAETNAEAAQVAAELARDQAVTARIAAELAETNAETAETNAETAETNAETARDAALAAQSAAEAARDAAQLAETNAETAETNAEAAETNAETAATAALGYRNEAEGFRDEAEAFAASIDPDFLRDRANHTGTQSADTVVDGVTNHVFTAADDTKLAGIATGATQNSSDATLLARANHTGTQTASTISDFSEAVDDRVNSLLVAGTNVTLTYNDGSNTLTVDATGGGGAPRGYIFGLTLSNNTTDATNDIDIAAGEASSDDSSPVLLSLAAVITKRLDAAWTVGTNQGGLDTGSIANTTYHVFLIRRPDTGVVDVLFSTSATAPTMPTSYTQKRRIGSILRVSNVIVPFMQFGDEFIRSSVSVNRSSTSAAAIALLTVSVPTGIVVQPILGSAITAGASFNGANQLGSAFSGTGSDFQSVGANGADTSILKGVYYSNTSAQVYFGVTINAGTLLANVLYTIGWIDTRGRNS